MDDITRDDLIQYRHIVKEIESIRAEIETIYAESPPPKEVIGGRSSVSTPGDPTARKAMKAIEARERLEAREKELQDLKDRIDNYILSLEDHHIAAIIRWHYILGKSWRETGVEVYGSKEYGYRNADNCQKAVQRHFEKKERDRKEGTDGTETD